tara:strand:- start:297 stop:614 length:318 start_codon:yes stop_codon:yes gene_type:complete
MAGRFGLKNIEVNTSGISIDWDDGHRTTFDPMRLRLNCGCAECVEEWTQRKLLDPASVPANIAAEDYLMVGNYAVQFLWSDAHFTGIYPLDLLRRLCDCNACSQK